MFLVSFGCLGCTAHGLCSHTVKTWCKKLYCFHSSFFVNLQIIFLTVHKVFLFPLYFHEVLLPLCDSVPAPCTVHSLHSQLLPRYSLVLWVVLSVPADDNLKSSLLYLVILCVPEGDHHTYLFFPFFRSFPSCHPPLLQIQRLKTRIISSD